jgi:hypothetical protein
VFLPASGWSRAGTLTAFPARPSRSIGAGAGAATRSFGIDQILPGSGCADHPLHQRTFAIVAETFVFGKDGKVVRSIAACVYD